MSGTILRILKKMENMSMTSPKTDNNKYNSLRYTFKIWETSAMWL